MDETTEAGFFSDGFGPIQELDSADIAAPEETIDAVRMRLSRRPSPGSVPDVVVMAGVNAVGLLRFEDVVSADSNVLVSDVMDVDPPTAVAGADWLPAIREVCRRDARSLIVADEEGRALGVVSPSTMLHVMLGRHARDLARLGGFLHDAAVVRRTTEEPVWRRFRHRLPWLLLGLAAAVGAAGIVGAFEARLERNITLAFFIPAIVYLADAVGTQTETLVIRGMSLGVDVRRLRRQEIVTGVLLGVVLAALFAPIGLVAWGDPQVVAAVSIAIAVASSSATFIAMLLPQFLSRRGADPAFGSGPLATVAQDLVSLFVYFAVASWVVRL